MLFLLDLNCLGVELRDKLLKVVEMLLRFMLGDDTKLIFNLLLEFLSY